MERQAMGYLPGNLNILGFEMALMVNFNLSPGQERIAELYEVYKKVKGLA